MAFTSWPPLALIYYPPLEASPAPPHILQLMHFIHYCWNLLNATRLRGKDNGSGALEVILFAASIFALWHASNNFPICLHSCISDVSCHQGFISRTRTQGGRACPAVMDNTCPAIPCVSLQRCRHCDCRSKQSNQDISQPSLLLLFSRFTPTDQYYNNGRGRHFVLHFHFGGMDNGHSVQTLGSRATSRV